MCGGTREADKADICRAVLDSGALDALAPCMPVAQCALCNANAYWGGGAWLQDNIGTNYLINGAAWVRNAAGGIRHIKAGPAHKMFPPDCQ